MNNSRLNILLQYLQEEPDDPFNLYAIALEYNNIDKGQAKKYFDLLLDKHEEYIPTYYHAAHYYAEEGNLEKAEAIYKKGIGMAQKLGNHHALRELRAAYEEMIGE